MVTEHPQPVQATFDWNGLTLFLISIGAILLCSLIVQPFFPAITGAVVLAIVTQSPYRWIAARLRSPTLAAAVSLSLVILSIVVPLVFFTQSAAYHILDAVRALQRGAAEQDLRQFIGQHPRLSAQLHYTIDNVDINQAIEKSAGAVTQRIGAILGGSVAALVQIVVMLFVLFFLYRDGDEVVSFVRSHSPLRNEETDYLLLRIYKAVQVLVQGRFIVAGIQGLVAGITFACLGVAGASLLGLATMLFALVPVFGAFVVWLPIAIYLALVHHWIRALILLGVGSLIISSLDNVLYPILVGAKLQMHTVATFLAMMGGVWFFGVSGLILGPIIFTMTESLLLIWHRRTLPGPAMRTEV
jgi:predicted PurR-regulated permease PerM